MKTVDPCNVCGSTDVNLVDGFYYCVECGTQDVNVRDTLIEDRVNTEGTYSYRTKKRVQKVVKDKIEMSTEWHKWHTYNFMLAGLADRLIELGAKPSFKTKLLWLWTQYMKKFQNKDELGLPNQQENVDVAEDKQKKEQIDKILKRRKAKMDKKAETIRIPTISAMLYLALNLDGSHIQFSDLCRFIMEGHINIEKHRQNVPADINFDCASYRLSTFSIQYTLDYSIAILWTLNIPPRLPDMRKLIDKYVKELCLPKDFKKLVLALMFEYPCNALEIDETVLKDIEFIPHYECKAMAYIVVAFKMCFGLDDDYEVRLSEAVEKINDDNCNLKSYKLGAFSEATDRLFSFREWCNFIQLRKMLICKYNLFYAEKYNVDSDDYISIEHSKGEIKKKGISDDIIINLLNKIDCPNVPHIIPKKEFKPTTMPWTNYTNIILDYLSDPSLKLLLSEDFSQYSLKYACRDLCLCISEHSKNIIKGVNETNKFISSKIGRDISKTNLDKKVVLVRNCNNKNWLTTLQPTDMHFITNEDINSVGNEYAHICDSNGPKASNKVNICDNFSTDVIMEQDNKYETESHMLREEIDNIFDDDFKDFKEEEIEEALDVNLNFQENVELISNDCNNGIIDKHDYNSNDSFAHQESEDESEIFVNTKTFDRDKIIREIILAKCKKYAIKIPAEYNNKEPIKRKRMVDVEAGKRKRSKCTNNNTKTSGNVKTLVKDEVDKLLEAYYKNLQHDVLVQISEHVKTVVRNVSAKPDVNNMQINSPNDTIHNIDQDSEQRTENDCDIRNTDNQINENKNSDDNDLDNDGSVRSLGDVPEECNEYDPMFDDKKYDINQLYVKVEPADDFNILDEIENDSELAAIVDKVIEKYEKNPLKQQKEIRPKQEETCDSEDDIPLSVMREEKMHILQQKENKIKNKFKPLVNNNRLDKFNYWTRIYHRRSNFFLGLYHEHFHRELDDKFPKSFSFVLTQCAQIIDCSPNALYKSVMLLEQTLL